MTDAGRKKEGRDPYHIDPETAASIRKLAEHNDAVREDEREAIARFAEAEADRLDAEARQARIELDFNLRDRRDIEGDAVRAFAAKLRAAAVKRG